MARRWKLLGLAGIAGVAATGVVIARRRAQRDYDPQELREHLHRRLAEVPTTRGATSSTGPTAPKAPGRPARDP
jgi:hypothetical protein